MEQQPNSNNQPPQGYPPQHGYPYPPPQGHPPQYGYPPGQEYPPHGYPPQYGYPPPHEYYGYPQPGNTVLASAMAMAGVSLACGIIAMFLPFPVYDFILACIGIILAALAKQRGARKLSTAGLVCSIIGSGLALSFTLISLELIPPEWIPYFHWF